MSHTDDRPQATVRRRGRPVGSDSVVTRTRILSAARRVINRRGYPAATFQAIALEADLSRPTLHYYFSSREEIYDALVTEAADLVAEFIATVERCGTLAESVTALVTAMHDGDVTDTSHVAFLISARLEAGRNPELRRDRGDVLHAHLASLVCDARARGELAPGTETGPIADMLLSVLCGVGMCAGFLNDQTNINLVTRQLGVVFAEGLLGSHPPGATPRDTRHDTPNAVRGRP